ncbi:phage tail tape measure protein [Rhodococcus sp. 15-1154-1]|nr:phage tail tape measure protein [Rhodococcus sp. 15-1154-1]OZF00859.1 phage tail tape measure protein [Rhodococcus sp. 15-1154-1]
MAGGRIDIEVDIDTRGLPAKLQQGMQPVLGAAGKFAGALGLTFGALAAGNAVKDVIALGNTFTENLNTMSAVSGATAEQIAKVSERAKELGNDNALSATSAADAAAAMSELAKGGFTVEQSMDAAKGTLQLAAAAQIDAATAATIQSQALQAFGLDASYAAKTSDILANAANASSAEITDVASGLQQSGAVANQFGLTLEDTAAGLGLLANAGIQGSDAGTLLKSALLALTDQSNPAQGAIEELGLTVYDAQGNFVGLSELFGQLDAAAESMSPEMYQAATATLFGSDAMRLAGVAAEQGRAGYDAMVEAVNREGAAAEVAAAKTQGLPGAMGAVQNSVEGLALGLYDLIDGPLESYGRKAADYISDVTPKLVDGLSSAASAIGPVVGVAGDLVSTFADLPGPVLAVGAAFASIKVLDIDDKVGGFVESLTEKFAGFREEMEVQQSLASTSAAEYDGLGEAIEENAEPLSEVAAGLATLEARSPAIRNMADGYRSVTGRANDFASRQRAVATATGGVTGQMRLATASVATFAGQVGGAAVAGVRGLRSAASGLIGVMGGPWMVGLMAASYAVTSITSELASASANQELVEQTSNDVADAQRDMAKAFQESKGAVTDSVMGALMMQLDAVSNKQKQLAEDAPGFWDGIIAGGKNIPSLLTGDGLAGERYLDEQQAMFEEASNVQSKLDELGFTNEDLAAKVSGSDLAWSNFVSTLRDGSVEGQQVLDVYQPLRDSFVEAQRSAATLAPGFIDLSRAVDVLADSSSTADDRLNALKNALDVMMGKQIPLSDAVADYNKAINDIVDSTAGAVDQTKGFGNELIGLDGAVNTTTTNGGALRDQLLQIKDASLVAADAAAQDALAHGQTVPEAQDAAIAAIGRNREALMQLATDYGVPIDAIQRMIEQEGLIDRNIEMLVALNGADETTKQLFNVQQMIDDVPPGVPIEVKMDDETARRNLVELGFFVNQLDNGNVEITAKNELALTALQQVMDRVAELGATTATPKIDGDTTGFVLAADDARRILGDLDLTTADPKVRAVIDDLLAGKEVSLAALRAIDTADVSPEVKLAIQQALNDATVVDRELDRIANKQRIARISAQVAGGQLSFGEAFTQAFPPVPPRAAGGEIHGPGTPTSDSILGVDRASGLPTAWVSAEEFVVNAAAYRKHAPLVNAINADALPASMSAGDLAALGAAGLLPALAGGGAIGRVQDLGSMMTGKPYIWGGAGFAGADCSGWVSMLQRAAMGEEPDGGRLGTTYTLLDGSWPGLLPGSQGPFVVGVNPDHMAATIAGENYESSDMVKRGGTSKGAFDPSFQRQFYLPWELFSPPYSEESGLASSAGVTAGEYSSSYSSRSKTVFTEKDRLALESAKVSVTQAQEDLAAAMANEKKSPADREQARIKVAQAEEKVRELESKRDAPGSTPAPDAPELTTRYTDEQLSVQDAQAAVEDARLDRNEVYAAFVRGEATQKDKDDADRKLQRALNALDEKGKPSSSSDSSSVPSSISEFFGTVAKDFVTENVADVLGYFGVDDELPSWVKAGMAVGEAAKTGFTGIAPVTGADVVADAPETFPKDELAGQLPYTPGSPGAPEWLTNMLEVLRNPAALPPKATLFDTGGEWESGTFGYNDSGHRELVLNHDQRIETAKDFALLSAFASQFSAARQGGSDSPAPPRRDGFAAAREAQRPFVIQGADASQVNEGMRRARREERWEASHVRGVD